LNQGSFKLTSRGSMVALAALALALAAALLWALWLATPSPAEASRGLKLGLTDPVFSSGNAGVRGKWLARSAGAGAGIVLVTAKWSDIASNRPSHPRNPGDSAYSWGTLDGSVGQARSHGLNVMILVTSAPRWAEGGHRPGARKAPPGTWKPRPSLLRAFGHAIAKRYSGHFNGLPRVRYFQLWAEANLNLNLTPQWVHNRPASPGHYRKMLNAFYGGVKGVSHHDRVVTSGLAPYGDYGKHPERVPPLTFWRSLLCLKGKALHPAKCRRPAHFDVAAHNPINAVGPTKHALRGADVSTPDLGKIKRVLRKAAHTGRAKPGGRKPFWATEIWWDSKPPDPQGVPLKRQARWLEQALHVLWSQGVRVAVWFEIRDAAPRPSFAATQQSGLYFRNGKPKPALRAYRFPFVVNRAGGHRVRVWGKAPSSGSVAIQRHRGKGWKTVKRISVPKSRVFTAEVHVNGHAKLRARSGRRKSLVW
jgi:hypothetical protein